MAEWLKKYFGKEGMASLNPTVAHEGKKKAIVRLNRTGGIGFSGIGYILVDKNGQHSISTHVSLHEGVPTLADMERMKAQLKKEDA